MSCTKRTHPARRRVQLPGSVGDLRRSGAISPASATQPAQVVGSAVEVSSIACQNDAPGVPDRTVFLACSGAIASTAYVRSQYSGEPVDGLKLPQADAPYAGGQPQLGQLVARLESIQG
jgi:hypothetical protein